MIARYVYLWMRNGRVRRFRAALCRARQVQRRGTC